MVSGPFCASGRPCMRMCSSRKKNKQANNAVVAAWCLGIQTESSSGLWARRTPRWEMGQTAAGHLCPRAPAPVCPPALSVPPAPSPPCDRHRRHTPPPPPPGPPVPPCLRSRPDASFAFTYLLTYLLTLLIVASDGFVASDSRPSFSSGAFSLAEPPPESPVAPPLASSWTTLLATSKAFLDYRVAVQSGQPIKPSCASNCSTALCPPLLVPSTSQCSSASGWGS